MKIRMVFCVVAGALVLAAGVSADVGTAAKAAPVPRAMDVGVGKAEAECEEMIRMRLETRTRLDILNASLKAKLATLKAAKEKRKVRYLFDVVEVLAAQNQILQEIVNSDLPKMMVHLMAHGQGGDIEGMGVSMADCPMMKSIHGGVTHPTEQFKFTKEGLMDRR